MIEDIIAETAKMYDVAALLKSAFYDLRIALCEIKRIEGNRSTLTGIELLFKRAANEGINISGKSGDKLVDIIIEDRKAKAAEISGRVLEYIKQIKDIEAAIKEINKQW